MNIRRSRPGKAGWSWMDNPAIDKHFIDGTLSDQALKIYVAILRFTRPNGYCLLSAAQLVERLRVSRSKLDRATSELESCKLLLVISGKRGTSNRYALLETSIDSDGATHTLSINSDGETTSPNKVLKRQLNQDLKPSTSPSDVGEKSLTRQVSDEIKRTWELANPDIPCPFTPLAGVRLAKFTTSCGKWTQEHYFKAIANYWRSDNINPADPPEALIPKLWKYVARPLNQFGHPKNGNGNGHGQSKSERRTAHNNRVTEQAIEELEREAEPDFEAVADYGGSDAG